MFGHNEIVGQKYFKDRPKDTLLVASRFFTLQGEGPLQGQPAIFVRLSKCNLACSFCDTYFDAGTEFTFAELFEDLDRLLLQHWKVTSVEQLPEWTRHLYKRNVNLVITGGEPSLQANLVEFVRSAQLRYPKVQIESNGLVHQRWPEKTILVISPKCLEVSGRAVRYLEPSPQNLNRADCLKFVISADEDSAYCGVPAWALEWKRKHHRPVYVSPMNTYTRLPNQAQRKLAGADADIATRSLTDEAISFWDAGLLDMKSNQRNHEYAARYARDTGLFLTLQMHLMAGLA